MLLRALAVDEIACYTSFNAIFPIATKHLREFILTQTPQPPNSCRRAADADLAFRDSAAVREIGSSKTALGGKAGGVD